MNPAFIPLLVLSAVLLLAQRVPFCQPADFQPKEDASFELSTEEVESLKVVPPSGLLFNAVGNSMFPSIKNPSVCLCKRTGDYEIGDIVLFFFGRDGKFTGIAHRIVDIQGEVVITRGDNNVVNDLPILEENILCEIPQVSNYELIINKFNLQP